MDYVATSSGGTVVMEKTPQTPKLHLNSRAKFRDMNRRLHPEARLMSCQESIQRKLANDFMMMLRSGILGTLANIANNPQHPASQAALTFLTSHRRCDDPRFFNLFVADSVLLEAFMGTFSQ
jgi:hypothetical protein